MEQKDTLLEKIGKAVTIAGNTVMMNLLFLIACLPVVTIGAAWSGLFSAIRYNIRGEKWIAGFRAGYKTRFWRSLLSWLIMIVPILYVLEFDLIAMLLDETGAFRAWATFTPGNFVLLAFACVMFLMLSGMLGGLILLNVYIPTKVGDWVRSAANMVFKYPLRVAVTGLLMWFPVLMVQLLPAYFYIAVMIFVVAYFVLAALLITMVMKKPLLDCLQEARSEGTLLREEEEDEGNSQERSEDND